MCIRDRLKSDLSLLKVKLKIEKIISQITKRYCSVNLFFQQFGLKCLQPVKLILEGVVNTRTVKCGYVFILLYLGTLGHKILDLYPSKPHVTAHQPIGSLNICRNLSLQLSGSCHHYLKIALLSLSKQNTRVFLSCKLAYHDHGYDRNCDNDRGYNNSPFHLWNFSLIELSREIITKIC